MSVNSSHSVYNNSMSLKILVELKCQSYHPIIKPSIYVAKDTCGAYMSVNSNHLDYSNSISLKILVELKCQSYPPIMLPSILCR